MSYGNLNYEGKEISGFDSIIIQKDLADVPGGVTLDVTGYEGDSILSGHVLIKDANGAVKPLGIESEAYASLGEGEAIYGILKYSVSKSQPFAAVLLSGTVNAGAAEKLVGAPYTDTIKAALKNINFIY